MEHRGCHSRAGRASASNAENACERFFWALQGVNFNVYGIVSASGGLVERYEYTPYGQRTVYSRGWLRADLNGDGVVDDADTDVLSAVWRTAAVSIADIDGDGAVNLADLALLADSDGDSVADDPLVMHSRLESFRTDSRFSSTGGYGSLCDIGHQGLLHDKEFGPAATGLVHNRRRTLNPPLARFNQIDPIGYPDGMNGYEYCGSSPPGYLDPEGTLKWTAKFLTYASDSYGTFMTPRQKKEYMMAKKGNRYAKMRELVYREAAAAIVTWEFKCGAKSSDGQGLVIVDKSGAGPKKVTSTNDKVIWAALAKAADLVGLKAKTKMTASVDASVSDAVQFNSIGRKCKRIGLTYKAAVQYDGGIDIMAPAKLAKLPYAPTIMLDKSSVGAQNVIDLSVLVCCTCHRDPKNRLKYAWEASWLSMDRTGSKSGLHGDKLLTDVTAILGASSEKKKGVYFYNVMKQNNEVLEPTKQWKDNREKIWTVPVD